MKTADFVMLSHAVFDSVSNLPYNGGVALAGDKIIYVGAREDVKRYIGTHTIVRDFGEQLIMPGFCDGHVHFDGLANKAFSEAVDGLENLKSEDECANAVKAFSDAHPYLNKIHGFGWLLSNWGHDPKHPTRESLDRVLPDKPVYLRSSDAHTMWLNSKAIEECNIDEIIKGDSDITETYAHRYSNGQLTGFFAEKAGAIAHSLGETDNPEQKERFHKGLVKLLNSYGITGFTDATMMSADELAGYYSYLKAMENNGELTIRCHIWAGTGPDKSAGIQDAEKITRYFPFFNSDKLHIAGIKSVIDGVPENFTAALLEPYSDNPSTRGNTIYPADVYQKWTEGVNRLGYSIKFHCCGDAAIRLALDCFEKSNDVNDNSRLRNAVEHNEIVHPYDIHRFAKLEVIASMQPAHLILFKGMADVRYGGRSKRAWNFRKLINAGAKLSIGTDSPVVDINPFNTIYKAITRKDLDGSQYSPFTVDQALTLPEVLKGYTVGSAYASNMDLKVGTLEAGKFADIIVVDRNLFEIPADEIKECRTVCTVFDGRIIFESDSSEVIRSQI